MSLLQFEKSLLSQAVLTGEVLQTSAHAPDPPLDSLPQVHILSTFGLPELDAVLQVGFH